MHDIEQSADIRNELISASGGKGEKRKKESDGVYVSEKAARMRRKRPTSIQLQEQGQVIGASTSRKRQMETIQAANAIHGGSDKNPVPATVGLVQTIDSRCRVDSVVGAIDSCSKIKNKVVPQVYKKGLNIFEGSTEIC